MSGSRTAMVQLGNPWGTLTNSAGDPLTGPALAKGIAEVDVGKFA